MKVPLPSRGFGTGHLHARGIAAVEFVVTVPVLILLMLAVAELGHALIQFDTLTYSVRNSARFVSEHVIPGDTDRISSQLIADVQDAARNLVVYGSVDDGGSPLLRNGGATEVSVSQFGDYDVQVTATYPYEPLLGAVLPTFDMRVVVTMRAIS